MILLFFPQYFRSTLKQKLIVWVAKWLETLAVLWNISNVLNFMSMKWEDWNKMEGRVLEKFSKFSQCMCACACGCVCVCVCVRVCAWGSLGHYQMLLRWKFWKNATWTPLKPLPPTIKHKRMTSLLLPLKRYLPIEPEFAKTYSSITLTQFE